MSCSASAPQWPPKPEKQMPGGGGGAAALGVPSVGLPTVPRANVSLSGVMEASQAPPGLAKLMADSRAFTASRFWIVDNSGSMASADGSKRVPKQDGTYAVVKSTRWEELRDVVLTQAQLASSVQSRADFHLLNSPGSGARQFLSLGIDNSSCPSAAGPATLEDLGAAMATGPRGTTPLTQAVDTICGLLSPIAPAMRSSGHVAVVVIATDGLPDHPDSFVRAVSDLQRLGCTWLVVRLCTDSDDVIDYWNDLDRQLEAPLEVLDDPAGEAKEVQPHNPWLTYGFPLHLAREFGLQHKLLDLLDETPFLGTQVGEMASLLYGCGPLPNPEADFVAFQERVGVLAAASPRTFCPLLKQLRPWVNVKELRDKYGRSAVKRPVLFGKAPDARLGAALHIPPDLYGPSTGALLTLTASAQGLSKPSSSSWGGSAKPFFTVSCWGGEGQHVVLANSEALTDSKAAKEPRWSPLRVPVKAIHDLDPHKGRLRFDVFGFDSGHCHELIGYEWTTLGALSAGAQLELSLRGLHSRVAGKLLLTAEQ